MAKIIAFILFILMNFAFSNQLPFNSSDLQTDPRSDSIISGNSTKYRDPGLDNCTLQLYNDDTSTGWFTSITHKNPAMVYVHLNFVDLELDDRQNAFLTERPQAINPVMFTWDIEGKGAMLRSLPTNYLDLSLNTLHADVYRVDVNISTNLCEGFIDASDETKLNTLATFLIDDINEIFYVNHTTAKEFKLCREAYADYGESKAFGTFKAWLLNLHVYLFLPGTIETHCSSSIDYSHHVTSSESFVYNRVFYLALLILNVCCFPLFLLSVVVQRNPPVYDKKSKTNRLYETTGLPVGLKYMLCFWRDRNPCVRGCRRLLFVFTIIIISYTEGLIFLHSIYINYDERKNAAYRSVVNKVWYWVLSSVFFVFYSASAALYSYLVFKNSKRGDNKTFEYLLETDSQRQYFWLICCKSLKNKVPKPEAYLPWENQMHFYMKYRWSMAVDVNLIWHDLLPSSTHLVINMFKVPTAVICSFFIALLNCPSMYIFQLFFASGIKRVLLLECSHVKRTCLLLLYIVIMLIGLCGGIRILVGTASLTAHVLEFTFIGIVLNTNNLDPYFVMSLTLVVYVVITINQFYDKYYKLHLLVIDNARALCKEKIDKDNKRFHSISDQLFRYVADQCKPIRHEVCMSLGYLMVLSFLILIGYAILKEVKLTDQISHAATIIVSVVISIGAPVLNNTTRSRTNTEVNKKIMNNDVEDALDKFHLSEASNGENFDHLIIEQKPSDFDQKKGYEMVQV